MPQNGSTDIEMTGGSGINVYDSFIPLKTSANQ